MLNAEKFRDEILKITNENSPFGISKTTNKIQQCHLVGCSKCLFLRCTDSCNKARFEWLLSEYQEPPILDEVEREYLSAVCRPYKVVSISKKISFDASIEWIEISVEFSSNNDIETTYLPCFKSGTMYEGMEVKKVYTPQELGITCKNNPNGEIKRD